MYKMTIVTKRSDNTLIQTKFDVLDMSSQGNATNNLNIIMDGYFRVAVQVKDTPGANGTNTYKIKARTDDFGGVGYEDVTNDFTGSASYTSNFLKTFEAAVRELQIEVVRTGDTGENDGAFRVMVSRLP